MQLFQLVRNVDLVTSSGRNTIGQRRRNVSSEVGGSRALSRVTRKLAIKCASQIRNRFVRFV